VGGGGRVDHVMRDDSTSVSPSPSWPPRLRPPPSRTS
jgi:hypothetical protein